MGNTKRPPVSESTDEANRSIFEEFYAIIERHQLDPNEDFQIEPLRLSIESLDRAHEHLIRNSIYNVTFLDRLMDSILRYFLQIFTESGFKNDYFFYSFIRLAKAFKIVLNDSGNLKFQADIIYNIFSNFPSLKLTRINIPLKREAFINLFCFDMGLIELSLQDLNNIFDYDESLSLYNNEKFQFGINRFLNKKDVTNDFFQNERNIYSTNDMKYSVDIKYLYNYYKTSIDKSAKDKLTLTFLTNNFSSASYSWNDKGQTYINILNGFYLNIVIDTRSSIDSVTNLFEPSWMIASTLESLKNVKTELLKIEEGSLLASFRVWMGDIIAKEEVKGIFQNGKKAAILDQFTDIAYEENTLEGKVISIEEGFLDKPILNLTINKDSTDTEYWEKMLKLEKLALENAEKEIDIKRKKLEIERFASERIKRAIVDPDDIYININDIEFIFKRDGNIDSTDMDISEIIP